MASIKETLKALVPNTAKKAILEGIILAGLSGFGNSAEIKKPDNMVCENGVCKVVYTDNKPGLLSFITKKFSNKSGDKIDDGKVIVDFYTEWCGPCKVYSPKFEEIGEKYADKNITFMRLDAEKEKDIAKKFDVTSYPTTIFLNNGKIKGRFCGNSPDRLETKVKAIFLGEEPSSSEFNFTHKNDYVPENERSIKIFISPLQENILKKYEEKAVKYKGIKFNAFNVDGKQAQKYGLIDSGIVLLNNGKVLCKEDLLIDDELDEKIMEQFFNKKIEYSNKFIEKPLKDSGFPIFIPSSKRNKGDDMISIPFDNSINYLKNKDGELEFKEKIGDWRKSEIYKNSKQLFITDDNSIHLLIDGKKREEVYSSNDLANARKIYLLDKKPKLVFSNKEGEIIYIDGKEKHLLEKFANGNITKIRYIPDNRELIFSYFDKESKKSGLIRKISNKKRIEISDDCYDFELIDLDKDNKDEIVYSNNKGVFLIDGNGSRRISHKSGRCLKAYDIDANGFKDIIYEGAHLYLIENKDGTDFKVKYLLPKQKKFTGIFDVGDINGDGYGDIAYLDKLFINQKK